MKVLLLALALLGCWASPAYGQFRTLPGINLLFKNQYDRQSRHHGRWVSHSLTHEMPGKTTIKGRYAHGLMVGTWRSYYPNKKLQKLEVCSQENGWNIIETTTFYPNGNIAAKGKASMEVGTNAPHYFFLGDWAFYQENGVLEKTIFYDDGWPVRTTYADGRIETSKPMPRMSPPATPAAGPASGKKAGTQVLTVNENKQAILITYQENGDSTVTKLPARKAQE